MKYLGFLIILISPIVGVAQKQVVPVPIMEKEIRNGTSLKMRSAELQRIKKESIKKNSNKPTAEKIIKFGAIKKDFESIQKSQLSIIKAYTKGKKINYKKIAKYAESMTISARRLDVNMFGGKKGNFPENKSNEYQDLEKISVRDLIIKLDKTIGDFVLNPLFEDLKTVDTNASKKAQIELKQIIFFSQKLLREAQAFK